MSLKWQAWKAALTGDYARAGDLYKLAGNLEKAVEMYLKGGHAKSAAAAEILLGKFNEAADHLLEAGDPAGAAAVLREHKQYLRAAQIYAEMGNLPQAAALAMEARKPLIAAQYCEQDGKLFEAGIISYRNGQLGKALLLLEKALRQFPSFDGMDPVHVTEWRQKLILIGKIFEEGKVYDRAASVFEAAEDFGAAARNCEAARAYSKALELYRLAGNKAKVAELIERSHDTPMELKAEMRAEAMAAEGDLHSSAELLLQAGALDKAATRFEEVGEHLKAARLWRDAGEWERAAHLFFRSESFLEAAECYDQAQLFDSALASYEKAGDRSAACDMAYKAGQWEKAYDLAATDEDREKLMKQLQSVPERTPGWSRAKLLIGRAFVDLGHPDLAHECIKDLTGAAGVDGLTLDYIEARAMDAMGNATEAAAGYRRILTQDMGFADARARLAALEDRIKYAGEPRASRYRIGERRESDSLGTWYTGEDLSLKSPVLLCRIRLEDVGPDLREALRETVDLRHPRILGLRDVADEGADLLLVYDAFDGEPLDKLLASRHRWTTFEALALFRQIVTALQEVHSRDRAHGALQPSCVLVGKAGDLKIRGFGLASAILKGGVPPPYAPPESVPGEPSKASGDLFAAGVILAALLSPAALPQADLSGDGETPSVPLPVEIHTRIKEMLARLMARDGTSRYSKAQEVLAELDSLELPPGAVIADRYEILEELGRGGMGQVFRVKDRQLDEVVALKTLRCKTGMTDQALQRFFREIKLSRKITHPNVIRVFDLGQVQDLTFLTMEYIPGQTLSLWVRHGAGMQTSLGEKVRILRGIAAGLVEAHRQGIIHRDLKPQNVILTPDGVPKLLDFGIAFVEEGADLTQDGHFVGSPKYVSPEQIQGKLLDARSDVYCFGLLAYFLLTGDDAFPGESPTTILMRQLKEVPPPPSKVMRIPASLEGLVMKCLQKKPEMRPPAMAEVLAALQAIA